MSNNNTDPPSYKEVTGTKKDNITCNTTTTCDCNNNDCNNSNNNNTTATCDCNNNDCNNNNNNNSDGDDQAECGIWKCKPKALRCFARVGVFTGVYSFSGLLTSTLTSYVNSQVTTLERHFGFNSTQTGLIMAANDVGFLVVVLFVSYIAAKVHIPRGLGYATILFGISGIICALPYFMFGAPSLTSFGVRNNVTKTLTSSSNSFTGELCDGVNSTAVSCDVTVKAAGNVPKMEEDPGNQARANAGAALVVIFIGMILQGIAKTPRFAFTTTYIDANVAKTKTGFYMGIVIAIGIMGPAVAFALGGIFTRIYVTLEDTEMHYRHPKWIGAWWLGYIIFGIASCVFAVPLFCFPRRTKMGKGSNSEQLDNATSVTPKMILQVVKGFVGAVVRLWLNPIYMLTVFSAVATLFAVAGAQAFTPKYIEHEFSFPAWKANMSMAAMMLSTACLGTFVGGYLSKRFKMGPMASLKFSAITHLVSAVCTGCMIFFKCHQPYLFNSPGPRATSLTSLPGCHDDCACDDDDYFPVCGDDGRTFFSPCHAGCLDTATSTSYTNCSCIAGETAIAGMCDYSCSMFVPYMLFMCVATLFNTFAIVPKMIIYIRCVEERDKPLALGYSSFMTSTISWMLGPIIFGKVIDNICIQWDKDVSCTGSGSCRLYDNDSFRLKLIGYQLICRCIAVVFVTVAFTLAKVKKVFEVKDTVSEEVKPMGMDLLTGKLSDHGENEEECK